MSNITGRDGYIMCKALAYAIATIPYLPKAFQESSDRDDMLELLRASGPNAQYLLDSVADTVSHIHLTDEDVQRMYKADPRLAAHG
jgi:hypothetical protein